MTSEARFTLRMLAAGVATAAALAWACGGDTKPPAAVIPVAGSGDTTVTARDTTFSVDRIEVRAGATTKISLENHDAVAHTLRVYVGAAASGEVAADTGEVGPGDSGEAVVLFNVPGEHSFECAIHPDKMHGTLVVR